MGGVRKGRHPALWATLGRTPPGELPLAQPQEVGEVVQWLNTVFPTFLLLCTCKAFAHFLEASAVHRACSRWGPVSQQWAQRVLTNCTGQGLSPSTVPLVAQRGGVHL